MYLQTLLCVAIGSVFASKVDIVAYYPDANLKQSDALTLRGDGLGLNWNSGVPMKHVAANTWSWSGTWSPSSSGDQVQFKPLVNDEVWKIGANFYFSLAPSVTTVSVYPWFFTGQGNYHVDLPSVYSPQLKNTRSIVTYTPPSYYENTLKTYDNVLIMQDGQNLFNVSTSFMGQCWYCQDTLDQDIVEGLMDEIVVIGVYNTPNRIAEYTYSIDPTVCVDGVQCGLGNQYLDFLEQTVLPLVKSTYRVETEQVNLGILGSSLGGLISCYAGWTRPQTWSKTGCMSSSFWWNSEDFNNTILVNDPHPPSTLASTFYLDSGTCCNTDGNDDEQQTIGVRNHFERLGYVMNSTLFYYLDHGGQHNEHFWGARFHVPMTDLYPPAPSA